MVEVEKQSPNNIIVRGMGRSTMFRRKSPSLLSNNSDSVTIAATVYSEGINLWVKDDTGRQIGVSLPKEFVDAITESNSNINEYLQLFDT